MKTLILYLLLTTPALCAYTNLHLPHHTTDWTGIAFAQDFLKWWRGKKVTYPIYVINTTCYFSKAKPYMEVECYDELIGLGKFKLEWSQND